jgi:hypothetical protein
MNRKQVIENKVNARNTLNEYLNRIIPVLLADIEKNGVKVKASKDSFNKQLFSKDLQRLNAITATDNKRMRAWFSVSDYNITLDCDIWFKDSEHSNEYVKETKYLYFFKDPAKVAEFVPFKNHNVDDVINQLNDIDKLDNVISATQSKISDIHKNLDYMFYR